MKTLKCLLLMAVTIAVSVAHSMPETAEDGHYKDGQHNDEYDHKAFLGKDQDEFKTLTREESVVRLGKLVDKIDKNRDENITKDELADWLKYIALKEPTESCRKLWEESINKFIKDDGLVSLEDFFKAYFPGSEEEYEKDIGVKKRMKAFRRRLAAADKNKDDRLSFEEFVALRHAHLFPHMRDVFIEGVVESSDANGDGVLTPQEIKKDKESEEDLKRTFDSKDINHDGVLDKAEMKEWYFPTSYDVNQNEASHLISKADSNKDGTLMKKEILDNYDIFVGSKATHWGTTLKRPLDEL